jgi:hypothetical protein
MSKFDITNFALDNAVILALLIPIGRLLYAFWKNNFATNSTEGIDLIARWSFVQRVRRGSKIKYFEEEKI